MSDVRFEHFLNELAAWSADPAPREIPQPDRTVETTATRREALLTKVRSRLGGGGGIETPPARCDPDDLQDDAPELVDTTGSRY